MATIHISITADSAAEAKDVMRSLGAISTIYSEVIREGQTEDAPAEATVAPAPEPAKKRGRPAKAETAPTPAAEPEPEPTPAEEPVEDADGVEDAEEVVTATREDVREILRTYFDKFGEAAVVKHGPGMLGGARNISLMPDDPAGFGAAVARLRAAVEAGKAEGA